MLSAEIDRNRETGPEPQVNRVANLARTVSVDKETLHPRFEIPPRNRKGIVLSSGAQGQELAGSPNAVPGPPQGEPQDRHVRISVDHWNPQTHEIVVLALEKTSARDAKLVPGESVWVHPARPSGSPGPQRPPLVSYLPEEPPRPLLVKDEDDYVLHLSHKYPPPTQDRP